MYKVFISMDTLRRESGDKSLSDIVNWAKENNLSIVDDIDLKFTQRLARRDRIDGFEFEFFTEEDAMTFKMRWS